MNYYTYFDVNGNVIGLIGGTREDATINNINDYTIVDGLHEQYTHYMIGGEVKEYSPEESEIKKNRPGVNFTFDNTSMTWVGEYNSIELYQKTINDDVEYKGDIYQADEKSYENMLKVYQSALITDDKVRWKLKNNEWVDIGVDDLKELIRMIHRRNQKAFEDK